MGRWIERRRRHQKRASRFEAMWGWPYSIWFVLWLAVFFGQFFFRLGAIWVVVHGSMASPSFSTLPENIAFTRAFNGLQNLPPPAALARQAVDLGDFRILSWSGLEKEKYQGPLWWFVPWPVRQVHSDYPEDISFKILPGSVSLCGSDLVGALFLHNDIPAEMELEAPHLLSSMPEFCGALPSFADSYDVLEERGYNGAGPFIPREAMAFHVRFIAYMLRYNRALAASPSAPPDLKNDYRLRMKDNALDYELYRDFFHRRVPEAVFEEWIKWD